MTSPAEITDNILPDVGSIVVAAICRVADGDLKGAEELIDALKWDAERVVETVDTLFGMLLGLIWSMHEQIPEFDAVEYLDACAMAAMQLSLGIDPDAKS